MFDHSDDIRSFSVMALLARSRRMADQGRDIIHLEVGEPDFPNPAVILDAAKKSLDRGHLGYTPAGGLSELRSAIARDYQTRFDVQLSQSQIIVTPGASGGLLLALAALCRPGGVTLLVSPGYPCNEVMAKAIGSPVRYVNTGLNSACTMVDDFVRDWPSERVDVVVLASPVNPTGEVLALDTIQAIAALARERGATLLVDEIYQGLVYDGPTQTVLSCIPDAVVINSFSKRYAMTGWRVGWVVANPPLIDSMERLAQNFFLAPPTLSQHVAIAALDNALTPLWADRAEQMKARRDFLLVELKALGLPFFCSPAGAFYLLFDVTEYGLTGMQFCEQLLDGFGVVMAPGSDFFADGRGEHLVRLAYTVELPRLKQAIHRLGQFLETLKCN